MLYIYKKNNEKQQKQWNGRNKQTKQIDAPLKLQHYKKGGLADSSDFGLLGKQSSQKWDIPCLERP